MDRQKLEKYILDNYGVESEYPWAKHPTFAVFRHENNNKWFAVIMTIDKSKLGIKRGGEIDVINVKSEPNLAVSMRGQQGIYPAYHMNKEHWLSIALDGSVAEENIKFLLSLSFYLTSK